MRNISSQKDTVLIVGCSIQVKCVVHNESMVLPLHYKINKNSIMIIRGRQYKIRHGLCIPTVCTSVSDKGFYDRDPELCNPEPQIVMSM